MGEEVGDELAACVVFIRKAYSSGDKNEGVNGKTYQWGIKEHQPMKDANTASVLQEGVVGRRGAESRAKGGLRL